MTTSYVFLEALGYKGRFSDNAFLVLPNRDYQVEFFNRERKPIANIDEFQASLKVRSLYDVLYQPDDSSSSSRQRDHGLKNQSPAGRFRSLREPITRSIFRSGTLGLE